MARVVLALDKQGWEMSFKEFDRLVYSGVDVIKLTAASLFTDVFSYFQDMYECYKSSCISIFMDLKVADIPFGNNKGTNYKILEAIAKGLNPVSYVTVHGFSYEIIAEAVAGANNRLKILALCALTSDSYGRAYGLTGGALDAVYNTALMAKTAGAYGLVLPGNKLDYISKDIVNLGLPIWSPGFGRQNKYGDIYAQLKMWRELVGDSEENAVIIGTHLLEHPDIKEEVAKIKELIR